MLEQNEEITSFARCAIILLGIILAGKYIFRRMYFLCGDIMNYSSIFRDDGVISDKGVTVEFRGKTHKTHSDPLKIRHLFVEYAINGPNGSVDEQILDRIFPEEKYALCSGNVVRLKRTLRLEKDMPTERRIMANYCIYENAS